MKHLLHPTKTYMGRPVKMNLDGSETKHGYFKGDSKTKLILEHLQSGKTLTQLECYPPSKFNTIRLGAIIKVLRLRGYDIKTEMVNNASGSRHGRYYMEV